MIFAHFSPEIGTMVQSVIFSCKYLPQVERTFVACWGGGGVLTRIGVYKTEYTDTVK
jgi:hypothetical protein